MKREYPPIEELRNLTGANKKIPPQYEEAILRTLYHYPELKDVKISFRLTDKYATPCGTSPSLSSALAFKRSYTVTILENAVPPMDMALLKNLPWEAQLGALGHELAHIVQYESLGIAPMLKAAAGSATRKIEREADIIAIEHGLGFELYTHACLLRSIPGYIEERKEIDVNYLHPNEILEALPPEQLQEIHR